MRIRLNGDPFDLTSPKTVLQLLEDLEIDPRLVAVEHNLTIIKRDRYATTTIGEGDEVEIVNFVGGGSVQLRTPNSELRTPNAGRRTPNAERRAPSAEHKVIGSRQEPQNAL